jgi:hypothetical protein
MTMTDEFAALETDIIDGQFSPPTKASTGQDAERSFAWAESRFLRQQRRRQPLL